MTKEKNSEKCLKQNHKLKIQQKQIYSCSIKFSFCYQMVLYLANFSANCNGLPSPNLDLSCIRQSDAVPFCENYAKLYFYAKHSTQGV